MLRPPSRPASSGDGVQDAQAAQARTPSPSEPPRSDESPTLLKLDSSVQRVRGNMIDLLPKLVIEVKREGPHGERTLIFHGEVCRIGTHSSNDLVLRDPAVSRFHCKLTREGAVWRVQDSGSKNRISLDRVRVPDAQLGPQSTIPLPQSFPPLPPVHA